MAQQKLLLGKGYLTYFNNQKNQRDIRNRKPRIT